MRAAVARGLSGPCCTPDGHESAYAWAKNPSAPSCTPATSYQFADFSDTLGSITRSGRRLCGETAG